MEEPMKRTIILLITVFLLLNSAKMLASQARIQAMGNAWLVVEDEDNQLNLYDFGTNPAWLINDQNRKWLKIFTTAQHISGDFKRSYDPGQTNEYHIIFDGVKPLGNHQIFRGQVDYRGEFRSRVPYAIERDIYREDPFRAMDNTIGRSEFIGPKIHVEYSRQITRRLFAGASLEYLIESGLKKDFPKPGNTYRNLGFGLGLAWQLSQSTVLGLNFRYNNLQNTLEMVEPGRNETRALVLRRYRGETVFTLKQGSNERFFNREGYALNFQLCSEPASRWKVGAQAHFQFDSLYVSNDRNPPASEGYWEMTGYGLHIKSYYDFSAFPIRLGLDFKHFQANDWARHPNFEVLLGDDKTREDEIGLGLGYLPKNRRFALVAAYHWGVSDYSKQDYVSDLAADGDLVTHHFQLGSEKKLAAQWYLRLGGELVKYEPDNELNQFSIFEEQYWQYGCNLGLGWRLGAMEVELLGIYGYRNPAKLGQFEHPGRNDFMLLVEIKLLKF